MKLSLIVLTPGRHQGQIVPIPQSPFLIGRDPASNLRPASPLIGERHCAIIVRDDKTFLQDFNSEGGTKVNDRTVHGEIELLNGDRIGIGPLVFGLHVEESVPVDAATPKPPPRQRKSKAEIDDEAAAALLLSLQDNVKTVTSRPLFDGPATGTTVRDTKTKFGSAGPEKGGRTPPTPTKSFGSVSSARDILKMYKKKPKSD